MTTINATKARADFYNLIKCALSRPIRITSEEGNVVMISEEEWENILENMYLMGVPGLVEDIEKISQMPRSEFTRWNDSGL